MGGHSLKMLPVGRLDKDDFFNAFEDIRAKLKGVRLDIVPAYKEKKDFGDLDIVVEAESISEFYKSQNIVNDEDFNDNLSLLFNQMFNSRQEAFSFPVISFEYRKEQNYNVGFQVDLIHIPKKNYDFSLHYLSYNDLGNLIGVMYRHMGLRFGHYGVNREVYDPEQKYRKIGDFNVTNDFDKALRFMGLDPIKFHNGFENIEEIYEYVSKSRFFNPDIYMLEIGGSNNYKSRRRNATRSTYKGFLQWIKEKDVNGELPRFDYKNADRATIIDEFFDHNYKSKIANIVSNVKNKDFQKSRMKCDILTEWTGLTQQALGMLTSKFKSQFENEDDMISYIERKTDQELKEEMKETVKTLDLNGVLGDPKTNPAPPDIKHTEKMKIKKAKMAKMRI